MLRIPSIAPTLAIMFVLFGGTQARCEFWRIDPGFGSPYASWGITGPPNAAGNIVGLGMGPLTSGIQSGPALIGVVQVGASESTPGNAMDFYDAGAAGNYRLSLFLIDEASSSRTVLTFGGNISVEFLPDQGPKALFVNHFFGPTTHSARLGSNLYTVSLDPFCTATSYIYQTIDPTGVLLPRDPPMISAFVDVQPAANNTTEPSCLALAGVGLACVAATRIVTLRLQNGSPVSK